MTQPRVVMVIQNFFPYLGGAENQALSLSAALVKEGVSVRVLTQNAKRAPASELIRNVPVLRLASNPLFFLFRSFFWLINHSAEYDIIHVHLASSHAIGASLAGRLLKKPVYVKIAGSEKVGELATSRETLGGQVKLWILSWLRPHLILVSKNQADQLHGYGLQRLSWSLIPNGVDTGIYKKPAPGEREELRSKLGWSGRVYLFVGRFSADKLRADVFENLMTAWSRMNLDGKVRSLKFVGQGPLEDRYRAIVQQMGLEGSVSFLPAREHVEKLYKAADLFLLPSLSEGLSNAMLEAMASGLPVFGSRVMGIKDIVEDGKDAVLFDPFDVADIENAFRKVMDQKVDVPKMAERSFEIAQTYRLENTVEKLLELYLSR